MANDSRFGLGAYLHTHDLSRAHNVAARLESGCVAVNGMLPMAPNQPFGGVKQSGFGREGGRPGLERSEEHTSELQSLMRISYAVFCLKKKKHTHTITRIKE